MTEPPRAPLSFLLAAAWSITATFAFRLVAALATVRSPDAPLDLVAAVACQCAAFLLVLYGVLRLHAPDRPLGDALALRPVALRLVLLAILVGVALQLPATALEQLVERRFPLPEADQRAIAEELFAPTTARRIGVVASIAVAGPLVEELFFRGGLFGALRRAHPSTPSLVAVAVFFAAAHQEPRFFVPILLVGLALGWMRAATGSLWPGLAMHAAFNGVSALAAVTASSVEELVEEPAVPAWQAASGLAAALLLLAVSARVARRDPLAIACRRADAG